MAVATYPRDLTPVACLAAVNSACQGLLGVVLSILALCVCFCALGQAPQLSDNNIAQYLTYYLQGDACAKNDYLLYTHVTGPTALRVWMALSLFFSVSMLGSSIVLIIAVADRWSEEKLQIALVSWIFINSFTAIDDVILGYVFAADYSRVMDNAASDNVAPVALGLITFLAFRGIYLWLLNASIIVYLTHRARALHKYLNAQVPRRQSLQSPLESWPKYDDFGKGLSKEKSIDRQDSAPALTAINPRLAERTENGQASAFPEHSALARWPTLNGQAHTMRERAAAEEQAVREQRSKTMRESSLQRQEGVDNPAYESDRYFRLESEAGSTRDFEEYSSRNDRSVESMESQESRSWELPRKQQKEVHPWQLKSQEREPSPWDFPKDSKREPNEGFVFKQYRQKPQDPWREKRTPPSATEYSENGVPIPPPDYYMEPDTPSGPSEDNRPYSLQEAILDRTLRLKKVPEELRKGFK